MSTKAKISIGIGAILACVLIVLCVVPLWSVEYRGNGCSICGAVKSRKIVRLAGVPIWVRSSGPSTGAWTDAYTRYIGEPHEHQWAGGSIGTKEVSFLRTIFRDGAYRVPPFPSWQGELTRLALGAVAQVGSWPPEQRKQLYHAMLARNDRDWFEDVRQTQAAIKGGDPNKVWADWLTRHETDNQMKAN
jgi:hypothetical protein